MPSKRCEAAALPHAGGMMQERGEGRSSRAYLLVALAALCWSGNHILGRAIAGHVPPMAVSTVRWLAPALMLWPLARRHLTEDWPAIRKGWRVLVFLALVGGAIFGSLQYIGLQYTTAINVSVLNSLAPVLIVIAGASLFGDRISLRQALGIAVSLSGVLVIVSRGRFSSLLAFELNAGDIIILFNMGLWAVYSACLRSRPRIHWLSFTFIIALVAGLATLPFWALEHARGATLQPTLLTAGALAYVSVFPSLVAYACWNRGVELIGANRAGVFLHLVPLYSAVLATLLLGERIGTHHIAGFLLILTGVWLAARKA
jgi:drug/metabolite transporter (DMT)-like permease